MRYKILSGKYEMGTQEQQMGYRQLFGEDNIQEKFDLYFHWFNIIHELGHILIDLQGVKINQVDEELFVNRFAVTYWKQVDACGNLEKVQLLINDILNNVPNPIPKGTSFSDFFKSIWGTEQMNTVMMYGYFQFSCVAEAFKANDTFNELLRIIGINCSNNIKMEKYTKDVNTENTVNVLNSCIRNLNLLGIKLEDIKLELLDNPEVQCCQLR